MNAIVWLYRGEKEKYEALLGEYRQTLQEYANTSQNEQVRMTICDNQHFAKMVLDLKDVLKQKKIVAKQEVENAGRKGKKKIQLAWDDRIAELEDSITIAKEAEWIYEKFGDGKYQDIPGLCKVATLSEIEEKGWSLTPGAYVGVALA